MSKKIFITFAFVILATFWLSYISSKSLRASVANYQGGTIPTRTPTSAPITNTPIPPTNSPSNPPSSDETATPEPTPTSTLIPATIAATPDGGFLETAVPCSNNPTVQAINRTRVRLGPGTQYDIIADLVYLEVRPIAARAADTPWWYIILDDGRYGWISDEVVLVQGYIDGVPIAEAPPINGVTPTPGTLWQPTPNPSCTVTPIPTETATVTPFPSATVPPPTDTNTAEESKTNIEQTSESTTEATPESPTATATVIVQPTTAVETATPNATAVPLDSSDGPPTGSGFNLNYLLIGAAGLAILGGITFIILKQQSVSLG